jgi:hypothetical protein
VGPPDMTNAPPATRDVRDGLLPARSSYYRAAYYRTRAAQLRELAQWQDAAGARQQFARLARRFDELAESLEEKAGS